MKRPQLFGKTLFVDFLASNLAILLGLMMLSDVQQKQKQHKQDEVNLKADGKYAVIMTWPDKSGDDVDLYVRDPEGRIAYFSKRDVGLMHLDHDDQGTVSDQAGTASGQVKVEHNEERTTLRGIIPGEYTVNVHMYNKRDATPTPVTVRLYRLIGDDTQITEKTRIMTERGQEATAFRFTLKADESVGDIHELEMRMVGPPGGPPNAPSAPSDPSEQTQEGGD